MARNELRPIIKLRSTADTGYTYVTRKNRRNNPDRLVLRKFDPIAQPPAVEPRGTAGRRHRERHERDQHRRRAGARQRGRPLTHGGTAGRDDQRLHLLHAP
ncbi:50S ribosomal protein L33 [Streptomyces sp. 110]|uniref:Large ribosomal subunit protein bL33 n=1 Tax=Streptomyces endocoffeicus TaxID=2898945 RepID=A0ABS1Q899_9ACTN|nr:50S ribosomal protein L33 [Streptomyces endocoffeicus]